MEIYECDCVSSKLQSADRQIESLLNYGVPQENIFIDKMSAKNFDRPSYQGEKSKLRESSTVVFHELDRMGRSYEAGMQELAMFREKKIS